MDTTTHKSSDSALLNITVCYALPERQFLQSCQVAPGTTLADAINASGLLLQLQQQCGLQLDLSKCKTGIFGKLKPLDTVLHDGDRVELYRPLQVDPKIARQRRVAKKRAQGSIEGRKWRVR